MEKTDAVAFADKTTRTVRRLRPVWRLQRGAEANRRAVGTAQFLANVGGGDEDPQTTGDWLRKLIYVAGAEAPGPSDNAIVSPHVV